MSDQRLRNLEEIESFNRSWQWAPHAAGGFTAVLRVKNEARNLPFVIPPLLRSVERIVIVDNQSTDETFEIAEQVAADAGLAERLDVVSYPFEVSRCGSEHLATPPMSVHSLTYFYNWAFTHVDTAYALKWDGDMVLTSAGEKVFRDLAWRLEATDTVVSISRFPLWVRSETEAYLDVQGRNVEPWMWPNRRGHSFGKGMEWEIQLRPENVESLRIENVCFEIKWLDEDEFDHWTKPEDFVDSIRTARKRREWEVSICLNRGEVPDGVVRVEAKAGSHVIETVRTMAAKQWSELTSR